MYFENYQVKNALQQALAQQQNKITVGTGQALLITLVKLFQVNQITSVKPNDVKVGQHDGHLTLSVDYNASATLYKNLSVVAHFQTEVVAQ